MAVRARLGLVGIAALAIAVGTGCTVPVPGLLFAPSCGKPGDTVELDISGGRCLVAKVFLLTTGLQTEAKVLTNAGVTSSVAVVVPAVPAGEYQIALHCADGSGVGTKPNDLFRV